MRTKVTVTFFVDAPGQSYAQDIVRHELDANKQMFKKWYNEYDNANGIVAFDVWAEDKK